jgi:hypothetical protein
LLPASLCMQFHSLHFTVQVNYNSLEQWKAFPDAAK